MGLVERGLNRFLGPERGLIGEGDLIERGANKRIYGIFNR